MGGIAGCTFRPGGLTTGLTATGQTEANAKCSDPACRLDLSLPEMVALGRQGKVFTLPRTVLSRVLIQSAVRHSHGCSYATPHSSQVQPSWLGQAVAYQRERNQREREREKEREREGEGERESKRARDEETHLALHFPAPQRAPCHAWMDLAGFVSTRLTAVLTSKVNMLPHN